MPRAGTATAADDVVGTGIGLALGVFGKLRWPEIAAQGHQAVIRGRRFSYRRASATRPAWGYA